VAVFTAQFVDSFEHLLFSERSAQENIDKYGKEARSWM
jgi:hypothetical protein